MQVSFRKRWLLVSLICLTQLVSLLAVGSIALRGVESRIRRQASLRAQEENLRIASQFRQQLECMKLDAPGLMSDEWTVVQNMVEAVRLPNRGFVSVIHAETGTLICHPEMGNGDWTASEAPGQAVLRSDLGEHKIVDTDGAAMGVAVIDDAPQLLAVTPLEGNKLIVQAHQEVAALNDSVNQLITPFRTVGLASTIALTLLTFAGSMVILRRYDNHFELLNRRLGHKVYDRTMALMKTRNAVIFGLAKLAESRDNDTGKHLERIKQYVTLLARKLSETKSEITESFVADLAFASSLHDIGKVGTPDSILLKKGPLTPEERQVIEQHAPIGGRCLEAIQRRLGSDDFLEMAKLIAYAHHERWDGTGYPFGLAEDAIPLAARIVAVADVYDALTTKRPYKRAFPHSEAYRMIASGAGTQFDPEVVSAFVSMETEFKQIARDLADHPQDEMDAASSAAVTANAAT